MRVSPNLNRLCHDSRAFGQVHVVRTVTWLPIRVMLTVSFALSRRLISPRYGWKRAKKYMSTGLTNSPMPEVAHMQSDTPLETHDDLYKFSLQHPDVFWGALARSRLTWMKRFNKVSDCDMSKGKIKWFIDGQLNASVNCVDRHVEKQPNHVALIWEKDEPGQEEKITYRQLSEMTNRMANVLLKHGVVKGDRVVIYLPVSPIAIATILGCARIGAMHCIVFAGFSVEALATRINDAKAKLIVTADEAVRGGKKIPLKKTVDEAVKRCPSVKRVLITKRTGAEVNLGPNDVRLEEQMSQASTVCPPVPMDSCEPLFMLYTSGSTGQPKGVVHSQAGYLLYAAVTLKHVFDFRPGDIFGCVADIGWITGHSYVVYGPLCLGGTTLLFESTPTYPDPGRYWEMVSRLKLTHFYGAPTAIRLLIKHGEKWVTKYDRSSLRVLGSVGEPLNVDAWKWYHRVVGGGTRDVVDTWWQTETGGVCIAPRPSAPSAKIVGGFPMRPMFGIDPVILDKESLTTEIEEVDIKGALCFRQPWPGLAITLYGDHERFVGTYFSQKPGMYFTGDGAFKDADGFYHSAGRIDDVINVTGHRLGTAEIEQALNTHPSVAESAAVGFPHEVKGEAVYAFVVLKESENVDPKTVKRELQHAVKDHIASYAVPEYIQICPMLPKTRSGKIMRRILRKVVIGNSDFGDISTLSNPTDVDSIIKGCLEEMGKK